ncbi:MAG: ATP-binding cassette domain-containing protein [Gammaproteobacteria bacterium]|nr:ATP-binding cassette domain-containing protein [Gammaproteobacteria bacterium]MCY4357252.1 ATP-binding cassette domain-containing protein [Gammaproteobacteria bacterium]
MSEQYHQPLADLAATGELVPCAGNMSLNIDDPGFVWFVERGVVDVFLFERAAEIEQSAPQHMVRCEVGRLLPGVMPQEGETTLSLVAKGVPGTLLRRFSVESLKKVKPEELAVALDAWIKDISLVLAADIMQQPSPDVHVEPGKRPTMEARTISTLRGVCWVRLPADDGLFMGLIETASQDAAEIGKQNLVPLTHATWLTLARPSHLDVVLSSATLAERAELLPALKEFHRVALALQRINRSLMIVDQANLDRARASSREIDEDNARRRLFSLGGIPGMEEEARDDTMLAEVLRIVGRHEGIDFNLNMKSDASGFVPDLGYIMDASGVRGRRVRLSSVNRWWTGDSGAMLAFRADDNHPVALLPGLLGRYRLVDPVTESTIKVTSIEAASLDDNAWQFYRPLEPSTISPLNLLRAAGKELAAGFLRFMSMGLLGGMIALIPALALGFVVDWITPNVTSEPLFTISAALVLSAVLWTLLRTLQGMALMRLEGRLSAKFESALWDRLLRLRPGFLRKYPAGDRAMRAMKFFRSLRDILQGVAVNDVLSILFVLPALVLIFLYNTALGLATAIFGMLSLITIIILAQRQLRPYGRTVRAYQKLSGLIYQLVNGIAKLRVEGAEGSAFAAWAQTYAEQQHAELDIGAWHAHLRAFGTALPLIGAAVILAVAPTQNLSAGALLTIYAAFMLFVMGLLRFSASIVVFVSIVPEFSRIRPFFTEVPEISSGGDPVSSLGGDIVFDHVSFRYEADGPLVLNDVSIRARPGEYVAIAGESGSGKSTLFQLALGLHKPTAGAVYYDGRDLRQLNLKQLRRKIGSVPQEVCLNPMDIWDNIVGEEENVDTDTLWDVVRAVGIDDVIEAMPMHMLTYIGDSQSVVSGGEAQRFTIARALLRKPRVLLLDEATNWLDNESQAKIMDALALLASTRIVIAHRLSTLSNADRIYVMRAGVIIEVGTYKDLIEAGGYFSSLISRQEI